MAYTPTSWQPTEPITQQRLMKIENGIRDATSAAESADSKAIQAQTDANTANGAVSSLSTRLGTVENSLGSGFSASNTVAQNVQQGQNAWSQIQNATVNKPQQYESLDARFNAFDTRITTAEDNASAALREINEAHDATKGLTLDARFDGLDSRVDGLRSDVNSNTTAITNAAGVSQGNPNLQEVTNLADRVTDIYNKIDKVTNEVIESRGSVNDTHLKTRFERIETEISNAHVGYTDLDARLDAIDSSTEGNNSINNRLGTLETTVNTNLVPAYNQTASDVRDHETRLSAVESEINTANGDGTLNDRFEVIEDNIDDIQDALGSDFDASNTVKAAISAAETAAKDYADTNKVDKIQIYNGLDQSNEGYVLDARQGKALNDTITDSTTGLAATKVIADEALQKANAAATQTALNNLTDRVEVLEASDTIIVNNATFNEQGNPTNISNPLTTADYLIKGTDNKYYYWRYIGGEWFKISGAGGGSGNNSGYDYMSEAAYNSATKALNTDYYVKKDDGYHHYRYVLIEDTLTEIEIGSTIDIDNIKRYNMRKSEETDENNNTTNYLDLYEFAYGEDTTLNDDDLPPVSKRIAHIPLPQGGGGGTTTIATRFIRIPPTTVTTIQNNDPVYIRFFYSSLDATGDAQEADYVLKDKNGITLQSGELNSGDSQETVNGWPENKDDGTIYNDGYASIDVAPYCILGSNKFYITLTTRNTNETYTRNWTVDVLQLKLESSAPTTAIAEVGQAIDIPYVPFGAMDKVLNIKVDTNEPIRVNLSSGITGSDQVYSLTQNTAGSHMIEMYLTATVNGESQRSESIYRDYIWYDENIATIIASEYRGKTIQATQYGEVDIPYTVYKANTNSIDVEYYYDYNPSGTNTPIGSVTLKNTNSDILKFNANEDGPHTLTIKVDETYITINLQVTQLKKDISPVPGAIIDFNPATLTNNSSNRLPSWTAEGETYNLTVSDNFNWSESPSGGGYKQDKDGACFVIKAGTYAYLDYKMFKRNSITIDDVPTITSNVFDNGAEMKLIFKVAAVRDASAIWFTNTGKSTAADDKLVGIQLSAHEGWLKTDKASDVADEDVELPDGYVAWDNTLPYAVGDIVVYKSIIYQCIKAISAPETGSTNSWNKKAWQSLGQLETEISATNSYLYFPYSEEDKIELDININKQGNNEDFVMSYEDGVPSKAYPYSYAAGGDILYHIPGEESTIRIGSPDCDVYIYRLRIYNKGLKTNEILKNFIADGATIDDRIERYDRNSIYYDSSITDPTVSKFTPYASNTAVLDPYHLAERMPDVKILMLDTPRFTIGKKDFVKNSSLRCIQAPGGKVYPARADGDNWYFFHGYHAGQGTTSDNYGQSARNVDFLFECDGTHYPTKSGNLSDFEVGYQSAVARGANASIYNEQTKTWTVAENVTPEVCTDWMGSQCKVTLTNTSIPNNYFNLKTNVASSENVNNALFQKRYNDFLPYNSPAKQRDSRIKNDMEFVPAVLFVRENDADLTTHKEFNDTNWHFYALGNIGDSKKSDYTRAYDPDDMNEFTVEISDNNTANSQFQSGVYTDGTNTSIETTKANIDPMSYTYPISSSDWNTLRDATAEELEALEDAGGDIHLPEGKTYANYRHHTLVSEGFDGDHSFEFRYACKGDYRDGDLINDTNGTIEVNGEDVSRDELQFNINRNVWFAFYEWVVTSTKEQFRAEAEQWFVPKAIEFFYCFTHYYTMMDNRAKNTFWHFAKTGEHRRVSRPVPELLHIYDELIDNQYVRTSDTIIQSGKQYYTEYAFDLWAYDTDTACGIDNNGELSFPYGKEDKDYRVAGQPGSGWAFNGSGSIFWRRLSDPSNDGGFEDEIATLMRQEDDNCFATAEHLINQFDAFQNCYPEEIWRLDIQRKYIRTFTGLSYDNSITTNKQNIRFLRAMMQGRKKYQRRQWVRNQAVYFGSKYSLSNVHTSDHTIEFNIYSPTVAANGVPIDYEHLVVVPYQDMYVDVAVGNSTTNLDVSKLQRAKAGERVTINCNSGSLAQETRVYIFGGEHIMALENLAPMYPYSGSFGQGKHLKVLDLGSDNPNYDNQRFTSISINADMPLLETFSVKNCNKLAQAIDLSQSNNLRTIEAEGSLITGVSLPEYTVIETLHLPSTVSSIVLKSARELNDFYIMNKSTGLEDYSNLITLNIDDSDYSNNIDWINIASQTLNKKISWLFLQNLSNATAENISILQPFAQKKAALETEYGEDGSLIQHIILSGDLTITGEWGEKELADYQGIWTNLNIIVDPTKKIIQHRITYKYDAETKDGAEIYSTYVSGNSTALTDPWTGNPATSLIEEPTKPSTARYTYTFGTYGQTGKYTALSGWRLEGYTVPANQTSGISPVTQDLVLETNFIGTEKTYRIEWYLDTNASASPVITTGTTTVPYGGGYDIEAPTIQDLIDAGAESQLATVSSSGNIVTYKIFNGWDKLPANITPNASDTTYKIYATWKTGQVNLTELTQESELTPEILLALSRASNSTNRSTVLNPYDQLEVEMGYKGIIPGTELPFRRFDSLGEDEIFRSAIQPFKDATKPFTIAIDYQFNLDELAQYYDANGNNPTKAQSVLAGCEATVSGTIQGFKLYYDLANKVPRVSFGNTAGSNGLNQTVAIGNINTAKYRNIVVIRHPENSKILYVYCYNNANGPIFDPHSENIMQSITWEAGNTVNTNAYFYLGDRSEDTSQDSIIHGCGTVYWTKYWDKDLGSGECKQLAAWPHETITFGIEDFNGMEQRVISTSGISTPIPNITLTSLSISKYNSVPFTALRNEYALPDNTIYGWGDSTLRSYAIQRIFNGLPIDLQACVNTTPVKYVPAEFVKNSWGGNQFNVLSDSSISYDKVFFPSGVELGLTDTNYRYEANRAYTWINSGAVQHVWQYRSDTQTRTDIKSGRTEAELLSYTRLRFPGIIPSPTPTIHIYPTNQSVPLYTQLVNNGELERGAIMIAADGEDAYIYVTSDDIIAGAQVVANTGIFTCIRGGWVKAEPYWTRTIRNENESISYVFMYVKANGTLVTSTPSSNGLMTCSPDFSFSI